MDLLVNLFFVVLGAILGWIPGLVLWVRDRYTTTGAPRVAFRVRLDNRSPQAIIQCKILVDITNERQGPVRITGAYFVFDKGGPLNPDPKWSREHGTDHFPLSFFCPPTQMHDWRDVYLRPGEKTDVWIGVDPQHQDAHLEQAAKANHIGRLTFQLTQWTDAGIPHTRWVQVKL